MSLIGVAALTLLTVAQAPAEVTLDTAATQQFLRTARVLKVKTLSKGATRPRRVTLSDGTLTHDAVFQSIDENKSIERFASGKVEIDFRDSFEFNIAAFDIAALIGLDNMVPVCIERNIQNERGSLCWWVTWKWDEQMRVEQKVRPPDTVRWQQQWDTMRVFKALVDDTDRNQTNMLITEDWHVWMVDFSRAFRKAKALREPDALKRCPKELLERLRTLDEASVKTAVGRHLRAGEIEGVMARRKLIVEHFDKLVAAQGAENVLF